MCVCLCVSLCLLGLVALLQFPCLLVAGLFCVGSFVGLLCSLRTYPPYLNGQGGGGSPNSIDLVFPKKGKMEPQMEFQGSPPSPNSIFEGVGMRT